MLKGIKIKKKEQKKKWEQENDFEDHTKFNAFDNIHKQIWDNLLSGESQQLKQNLQVLDQRESAYFKALFEKPPKEEEIFRLQKSAMQIQQKVDQPTSKYAYEQKYEEEEQQSGRHRKRKHQEQRPHKFLPSQKIIDSCLLCPENEQLTILSSAQYVYLALAKRKQYTRYHHLYICPVEHVPSSLLLQPHVYEQMVNYKKCLIQLFDSLDYHAVFFEAYYKTNSHLLIQCVVLPVKKAYELPFYFKQGLSNSQGEWSTNQKIIQIKKQKGGLLKQIPKKFRYFYIDFNIGYGFAHIIQEQQYWNGNFAHELIASLLGMDKHQIMTSEEYDEQETEVRKKNFLQIWQPYDWTAIL